VKVRSIGTLTLLACLFLVGCKNESSPPAQEKKKEEASAAKKDDHSGWWCKEHGIPEEECLVCLHSEEELKKMNDWCEKHEFAKSQCFQCDPTLKEKFAAKYRAKYGKEPPPIREKK
jgi:hypothetical protein